MLRLSNCLCQTGAIVALCAILMAHGATGVGHMMAVHAATNDPKAATSIESHSAMYELMLNDARQLAEVHRFDLARDLIRAVQSEGPPSIQGVAAETWREVNLRQFGADGVHTSPTGKTEPSRADTLGVSEPGWPNTVPPLGVAIRLGDIALDGPFATPIAVEHEESAETKLTSLYDALPLQADSDEMSVPRDREGTRATKSLGLDYPRSVAPSHTPPLPATAETSSTNRRPNGPLLAGLAIAPDLPSVTYSAIGSAEPINSAITSGDQEKAKHNSAHPQDAANDRSRAPHPAESSSLTTSDMALIASAHIPSQRKPSGLPWSSSLWKPRSDSRETPSSMAQGELAASQNSTPRRPIEVTSSAPSPLATISLVAGSCFVGGLTLFPAALLLATAVAKRVSGCSSPLLQISVIHGTSTTPRSTPPTVDSVRSEPSQPRTGPSSSPLPRARTLGNRRFVRAGNEFARSVSGAPPKCMIPLITPESPLPSHCSLPSASGCDRNNAAQTDPGTEVRANRVNSPGWPSQDSDLSAPPMPAKVEAGPGQITDIVKQIVDANLALFEQSPDTRAA